MGRERSHTYEVSSVKFITRWSTDLLLTHGKKKKKKNTPLKYKKAHLFSSQLNQS